MLTTDLLLFRRIAALPPNLKQDVLKYINFLLFSEKQATEATAQLPPTKKTPKAGFGRITFVMAPDFDAPLEDFKEYME